MFEEEKHNDYCTEENCETKARQMATVCVPVTVTPFAKVGTIVTECCGKPMITDKHGDCKGIENGSCKFTISQKIKVEIPVEFGANTTVGGTFVECENMKSDDCFEDHHGEHNEEYHEEYHN